MRYVYLHARAHALDGLRMPGYWIPALFFPLLFFVLFGYSQTRLLAEAGLGSEYAITPFLIFTTLNVTMAVLSAGVAADRENPWERRLRLLPVSSLTRFAGRLVYVLVFTFVSWLPLLVLAATTTTLRLPVLLWPVWLGAVLLGAIPFGLLGMAIGYRLPAQAATMASNVVFLVLAFLGGLFVPVGMLPEAVRPAVPFVPTHEYLQFVLVATGRADDAAGPLWTIWLLLGWAILFGLAAREAFRRDEGVRYG